MQVVEKTEHADLWLEMMAVSGLEALFGLMASSEPLQEAVLIAIKNLAVHPKGAQAMLKYDLGIVTRLTSCKVRRLFPSPGSPELFVGHDALGRVIALLKSNSIDNGIA